MSHIISNEKELLELNKILTDTDSNINNERISRLLHFLLPRNKEGASLVSSRVGETCKVSSEYVPRYNLIDVSVSKLANVLENNVKIYKSIYNGDPIKLKNTLLLYVLAHEVEHSYEYLISKGIVDAPKEVALEYKLLMELFTDKLELLDKKEKQLAISTYNVNPYKYVLERNSNLEASALSLDIAHLNKDEELSKVFIPLTRKYLSSGYESTSPMEETFYSLKLDKIYNTIAKDPNLDLKTRLNYGLEINKEEKQKVLKLNK